MERLNRVIEEQLMVIAFFFGGRTGDWPGRMPEIGTSAEWAEDICVCGCSRQRCL